MTDIVVPVNIRLIGSVLAAPYPRVTWLAEYDPEAFGGRGRIVKTEDRGAALQFPNTAEAMRVWQQSPKCHPTRKSNGKPNRPLTAYTIEILRITDEPLFTK